MNLTELDNFKLSDAINFHTELNPQLFLDDKMRPPVRSALLGIAQDFMAMIGVLDIALVDITVSGSNAAYSYTPHSDIDLHLIVDFNQLSDDEVFRELFDAKKYQYNDQHDIKVKGYDVEVYVQDAAQPHSTLGEYSVTRDDWNKIPTKRRANLDDIATKMKYEKLRQLALQALAADDLSYIKNVLNVMKRYRSAGLAQGGEFGPENLAFKVLRKQGLFQKLWDKRRDHEDEILSLEDVDPVLEEVQREYGTAQRIDETVKAMYKRDPNIFDRYSFDTIYAGAAKLVEDGRIVKGVNTTVDVGVDQIKIEAGKMGFKVTRDGVPPLLRESKQLTELNMSPGSLKKQVADILKKDTPIVGVEMEVCLPMTGDDDEAIIPPINLHTDLEDIVGFFEFNDQSDFRGMLADWEEWQIDQSGEWVEERMNAVFDDPSEDRELIRDILVNEYTWSSTASELVGQIINDEAEDIDNDTADRIIEVTLKTLEKVGPMDEWTDFGLGDLKPEAQLYYEVFYNDSDEAEDHARDKLQSEFFETELAWDDEKYTLAAYLTNYRKFENMQELFYEYSELLTWPLGGGFEGSTYNEDAASQLAYELSDLGIETEATGEYHSGQMDDNTGHRSEWNIEEDTSIEVGEDGDWGAEIISPALEYLDALNEIQAVVAHILKKGAYTNKSCGLHINVSMQNIDHDDVDYVKMILFVGETHILEKYGRTMNSYAHNTAKMLTGELDRAARDPGRVGKQFIQAMENMRRKVDKAVQREMGEFNFGAHVGVGIKSNRIEFRAAGGANYLQNIDDIINTINRVVVAYVVAADPEAEKKEYAKKLYKLMSSTGQQPEGWENDALKLFSLYAAKQINKEQLSQRLRTIQARRKPDKMEVPDDKMRRAVEIVSTMHDELKDREAAFLIKLGMEKEKLNKNYPDGMEVLKVVVKNLSNDEEYYG